jgi:tetratricopeptide (TPR) repeat protein
MLAFLVAACAPLSEPPATTAPQITVTETQLRERAKENFNLGLRQYDRGEYEEAAKSFTASLDHGLLSHGDQSTARKYLAFIHCVSGRESQCRDEFRKALEIDPNFSLSAAEVGHPIWGSIYRNVRAQMIANTAPTANVEAKQVPASVAGRMLADGMAKYDASEFGAAVKLLQAAIKEGLPDKAERIKAHKHAAFSLCLLRRTSDCQNEFMKIFAIEPDFELEPAEAKHPSWARIYTAAKQRAGAAKKGTLGK